MLLGCFALSRHLTFVPGQRMPLVILMGVLQVYEFLLLVLAAVKLVLLRDALALTSRRALAVAPYWRGPEMTALVERAYRLRSQADAQ